MASAFGTAHASAQAVSEINLAHNNTTDDHEAIAEVVPVFDMAHSDTKDDHDTKAQVPASVFHIHSFQGVDHDCDWYQEYEFGMPATPSKCAPDDMIGVTPMRSSWRDRFGAVFGPPEVKLERRCHKLKMLTIAQKLFDGRPNCNYSMHLDSYLERLEPSLREQKRRDYLALAENPNKERIDQMIEKTIHDIQWELDYVGKGNTLNTDMRHNHDGFKQVLTRFQEVLKLSGSDPEDVVLHNFADETLVYLQSLPHV